MNDHPARERPREFAGDTAADEHEDWLRETWRMISICATTLNPMEQVVLSPAGCAALLTQWQAIQKRVQALVEQSGPAPVDQDEVLRDPTASLWLKQTLRDALPRDPVDAANDAAILAAVLERRVLRLLRG